MIIGSSSEEGRDNDPLIPSSPLSGGYFPGFSGLPLYELPIGRVTTPEVSIIIPAYNTEAYIAKAIDSALNQTITSIEVIVIDDASTDRTPEVIQQFTDPRLQLLQNQQNLGVSASRNRALQQARGQWIAILDSDDWYVPNRLEILLNIAKEKQADIVIDDLHLIQNNEPFPWSTLLQESSETITAIRPIDQVFYVKSGLYGVKGLHLGLCKPLFRRSFLHQHGLLYDETQRVVEDFHLVLRCLIHGASMLFVPTPYYFYRSRPDSLVTHSKLKHIEQFRNAILSVIQRDSVQRSSELVSALSRSLTILKQNEHYYKVVEPLKQKKLLAALIAALENPYFFAHFMGQLRFILWRRYQYYILRDKLSIELPTQLISRSRSNWNKNSRVYSNRKTFVAKSKNHR
jgi:succinoglycan biosynthesis protein ExoO